MALTLRLSKGSPLSYKELDDNFGFITASFVLNSQTGSMLAPYVLTSQTSSMTVLSSSYARTASYAANATVFPYTGSATISGSLTVIGPITASNMLVLGTLQTNVLYSQIVTSSTSYSSGSNIFGNLQIMEFGK